MKKRYKNRSRDKSTKRKDLNSKQIRRVLHAKRKNTQKRSHLSKQKILDCLRECKIPDGTYKINDNPGEDDKNFFCDCGHGFLDSPCLASGHANPGPR